MLSALAPLTQAVTLGTATLLPFLRRPVQTAHALASIDVLSGGRSHRGRRSRIPGPLRTSADELSDVPWERRFRRLDETVALWRAWGAAPRPSTGEILHVDGLPPATRPARAGGPPVWLGGATPGARARTGRLYDGWLPYPPILRTIRTGLADVHAAAGRAGRDAAAVTPALFVTVRVDAGGEAGERELDRYALANYGMPLADLRRIAGRRRGDRRGRRRRAGAVRRRRGAPLVLRLGAIGLRAQEQQLDRLAALLPGVRAAALRHSQGA